jgi:hypothetical protein
MSCGSRGRRSGDFGGADVNAVIAEPLLVHVHLLMHLQVNKVMIRVS